MKRIMVASACAAVLFPVFASADDGLEAAKANSGSSFAEISVGGKGASGPSAVTASRGLKSESALYSAPLRKAVSVADVPAPGLIKRIMNKVRGKPEGGSYKIMERNENSGGTHLGKTLGLEGLYSVGAGAFVGACVLGVVGAGATLALAMGGGVALALAGVLMGVELSVRHEGY